MAPFDIYIRVSQTGGREGDSFASPELQEAVAREHAISRDLDVGEVVTELDVSGATPVDERGLGWLVGRCEAGESGGIIVRHLDRLGRNLVEGALAYKRLADCGARLIAVGDGLDSSRDGSKLQFQLLLAFAEQVYDRNRAAYISGKERAVARGVYGAPAPFGYNRDENGRLVANGDAEALRTIFRLRAEGTGFSEIARRVSGLTRSGVRRVVMNRAYVGEQRIPNPQRKGDPKVIRDSHVPLVTESEWQAANAVKGHAPTHSGLGAATQLHGIVRCGLCESTMHVLAYGKAKDKRTYACTSGCGKTAMAVGRVESAVLNMLDLAIAEGEPHVAAVIEGDNRYADALAEVEEAQRLQDEWRDSTDLQRELGIADFTAGLRTRREAVETARRALRDVPRPDPRENRLMTLAEFDHYDRRNFYRRVIAEARVLPLASGQRLTLRWQGSDEQVPVPVPPVARARQTAAAA